MNRKDCGYSLDLSICQSRMDYSRAGEIGKLFSENWDLFKLVEKRVIGGKPFIFSHAGLSKEFAEYAYPEIYKLGSDAVIEILNNSLAVKDEKLIESLGIYSSYRGWGGMHFGSVVWSDIREWILGPVHSIDDSMQIVGHTQLEKTLRMKDVICDLDVRETFYIDKEGEIKHMDSDEPVFVNEMVNRD